MNATIKVLANQSTRFQRGQSHVRGRYRDVRGRSRIRSRTLAPYSRAGSSSIGFGHVVVGSRIRSCTSGSGAFVTKSLTNSETLLTWTSTAGTTTGDP